MILRILLFVLLAGTAQAQSNDQVISHRILPGWEMPDGTLIAGLELTLAPGWKTYWRAPGDAGIPPEFDWSRTRNLHAVQVQWPTPQVFWQSGMRSVGYKERVVLPLRLTRKDPGQNTRLRGTVDLGICSDICVPHRIRFDTTLPAGTTTRSPAIAAALTNLPHTAAEAGLRRAACQITPAKDGLQITATLTLPSTGSKEAAVIEPPTPGVWVSEPQTARHGDTLTVSAEMIGPTGQPFAIDRSRIRITILGSAHAVDIQGCPAS